MKKVLFVVTSHDVLGNTGKKTGVWIEEFASPYYLLSDAGITIDIATPKGGRPPIDPMSEEEEFQTKYTRRFYLDIELQESFSNTLKLADVRQEDYVALFYPGGHGPLWDLADDKDSIALIESFYTHNKWISAVCHGPSALKNVKGPDGLPLVNGKKVNGFSNSEEEEFKSTDIVPFLTEDMLKSKGGIYSKIANWEPYVVEDFLLITGQNPASSELVAQRLLEKIS